MLRIKDVKARDDQYFIENPIKALVMLQANIQCAIENEFYLLEERIKVKLLALEICLDIDQTSIEYKSKTIGV